MSTNKVIFRLAHAYAKKHKSKFKTYKEAFRYALCKINKEGLPVALSIKRDEYKVRAQAKKSGARYIGGIAGAEQHLSHICEDVRTIWACSLNRKNIGKLCYNVVNY